MASGLVSKSVSSVNRFALTSKFEPAFGNLWPVTNNIKREDQSRH